MADRRHRQGFRFADIYGLFFLLILAAVILAIPSTVRFFTHQSTLPGSEPYYHARIAEKLMAGNTGTYDRLSFGGSTYLLNPYDTVLARVGVWVGVEQASRFLPYILGILSTILLFLILRQLQISPEVVFISSLLFISSPLFLDIFSYSRPESLAFTLFLLGFYLFATNTLIGNFSSMAIILIMPLFGIAYTLASLIILLAYSISTHRMRSYLVFFSPAMIFGLMYLIPLHVGFGTSSPGYISSDIRSSLVAGLGTHAGISLFVIIMFIIGIFLSWHLKAKLLPLYATALVLSAGVFYADELVVHLQMLMLPFAAYSLLRLWRSSWEVDLVKSMTLIVVCCGIVFSMVEFVTSVAGDDPQPDMMEALSWLGKNKADYYAEGIVLSDYRNGYWIEYWSGLPAFMDENPLYRSIAEHRYNITGEIFSSRDLRMTNYLLHENAIKYVYIDQKMRDGGVWSSPDEGMLLLLRNNETFQRIYSQDGNEIWQVLPVGTASGRRG